MEIVRFTPYPDSGDPYRGTTVLPYLEAFYQYEAAETVQDRVAELEVFPRHEVQEGNWVSEEEHFGRIDAQSNPSIHSASLYPVDRSLENIAQRKSRVSSQENGKLHIENGELMRERGRLAYPIHISMLLLALE